MADNNFRGGRGRGQRGRGRGGRGGGNGHGHGPPNRPSRALQTTPNWNLLTDPNEPLAIDIEFQNFRPALVPESGRWGNRVGRLALTNTRGDRIYDVFASYPDANDDSVQKKLPGAWRKLGVYWSDLKPKNGARPSAEVLENVGNIIAGRTIIGHGMSGDREALPQSVWSRASNIFDTQSIYGQKGLRGLAEAELGMEIQTEEHDPLEDAQATMRLYLLNHPYNGRTSFQDPEPAANGTAAARGSPKADSAVAKDSPEAKPTAAVEDTLSANIETGLGQLALNEAELQLSKEGGKGKKPRKPIFW